MSWDSWGNKYSRSRGLASPFLNWTAKKVVLALWSGGGGGTLVGNESFWERLGSCLPGIEKFIEGRQGISP